MKRERWYCEECKRWHKPRFRLLEGLWEAKFEAVIHLTYDKDKDFDEWEETPASFLWARMALAYLAASFDWLMWQFK